MKFERPKQILETKVNRMRRENRAEVQARLIKKNPQKKIYHGGRTFERQSDGSYQDQSGNTLETSIVISQLGIIDHSSATKQEQQIGGGQDQNSNFTPDDGSFGGGGATGNFDVDSISTSDGGGVGDSSN